MEFVNALIERAKETPYFHLDGYMNRWWIGNGRRARIHEILRSDNDRHLHDHPWDYTTIILRGGYIEHHTDGSTLWCPEGTVLNRRAEDAHKLELPHGPVITLFIMGPKRQGWGFLTENGKVPWREYLPDVAATEAKLEAAWEATHERNE
jgi:hypothetical protein